MGGDLFLFFFVLFLFIFSCFFFPPKVCFGIYRHIVFIVVAVIFCIFFPRFLFAIVSKISFLLET